MSQSQKHIRITEARIFLSYASEDRAKVRKVYRRLINEKLTPWLDLEDLLPGDDWERVVLSAIRDARFVLVFLSKKSISKRGYIQKEIREALDLAEQMPEGEVFIVPVRLEDCLVPERLSKWHWIDIFKPNGFKKLLSAIKINLQEEYLEKPKARPARESKRAQTAILNSTLFDFVRETGNLVYGKIAPRMFVISNSHIMDVFKTLPPAFELLKKEISLAREYNVKKLMIPVTGQGPFHEEQFIVDNSRAHSKASHVQVLTTKGKIKCAVQTKYYTYMIQRHPKL